MRHDIKSCSSRDISSAVLLLSFMLLHYCFPTRWQSWFIIPFSPSLVTVVYISLSALTIADLKCALWQSRNVLPAHNERITNKWRLLIFLCVKSLTLCALWQWWVSNVWALWLLTSEGPSLYSDWSNVSSGRVCNTVGVLIFRDGQSPSSQTSHGRVCMKLCD